MLEDLTGRRVIVTGASRGIGLAIARALADAGCNLGLFARGAADLERAADECQRRGATVHTETVDVTDAPALEAAIQRTARALKGVDALVNNAGLGHVSSAMDGNLEAWAALIDVNLRAAMNATRLVLPLLKHGAASPAVVFIASISSRITYAGGAAYCATKHGIAAFAAAAFEDVRAHGIKVSTISPGWVSTEMIERLGAELDRNLIMQPEDVAEAVLFVLRFPRRGCPTELVLRNVRPPYV